MDETLLQLALRFKQHVLDDEGSKDHHEHDVVQAGIQQPGDQGQLNSPAPFTVMLGSNTWSSNCNLTAVMRIKCVRVFFQTQA